GLSVALLFCFFNGEVIALIRKKWNQALLMRGRRMSYAATTVSGTDRSSANGKAVPAAKSLLALV
ncbi:g_PROTEIN_RECEP_F2_4 domain-containing protein, partial [Nephila pilipes]